MFFPSNTNLHSVTLFCSFSFTEDYYLLFSIACVGSDLMIKIKTWRNLMANFGAVGNKLI